MNLTGRDKLRFIYRAVAAATTGMFLVGASSAAPLDGKWSGDLRCSASPQNPTKLPAFSNPISMVVEECLRNTPGHDSVKKARFIDVETRVYRNAINLIDDRDKQDRQQLARAQYLADERQQQINYEKQRQEQRERGIAAEREKEEMARTKQASCNAEFARAKFPDALKAAFYLEDINSPTRFSQFICMAMSNGAQVIYLSGGAFSKEGFEVKSKNRTIQVFVEPQRIPGGDPKMPLMVPVSAKINGEKVAITRENFRAFMAELIAAILNR